MKNRYAVRARSTFVFALTTCLAVTACDTDELLEVQDPDIVTPDQAAGPAAVPATVAGMVGDFQEIFDNYTLYTALFTDEMILAGTFPTRIDVDERNVQLDPDNGTLEGDLFGPFQVARETADRNRAAWLEAAGDEAFDDVRADVEEGFALANLFGGYLRVLMSEAYCAVILEPKGAPLSPDAGMEDALGLLEDAEAAAVDAGLGDIALAARVGQARALLGLELYGDAAAAVASVPTDFQFVAEYSANQTSQWNEVFGQTWGANPFQLRWTVGDGTVGNRHNERWAYFDEWEALGLIEDEPEGFAAVEIGLKVVLQHLYDAAARPITVASGWEAQMIIAESELRGGQEEVAEDRVNALLADPSVNPMTAVNPTLALGAFAPVDFTGDLSTDLPQLARARSAGLWLTTERQATLRRFFENDGIDLYPQGTQGDDVSFPIPQQEIENNPNVSSGCPL